MSLGYPRTADKSFVAGAALGCNRAVSFGGERSVNFYADSMVTLWTTAMGVRLAASDERHLGRHDGEELHVGIEWQTRHVEKRPHDVLDIQGRLDPS